MAWDVQGTATALPAIRYPMRQQMAPHPLGMGMSARAQFHGGMGGSAPMRLAGPQGPGAQTSVAGQFANPNAVQLAQMNMPQRPPVDMSDPRNAALAGYR